MLSWAVEIIASETWFISCSGRELPSERQRVVSPDTRPHALDRPVYFVITTSRYSAGTTSASPLCVFSLRRNSTSEA